MRPRLYCAELRLSAERRSSAGTSSASSDEYTGATSAFTHPARKASTATVGTDSRPVRASTASTAAISVCAVVRTERSRRRSVRSASAPATGPSTSVGRYMSAATVPVQPARPVASVT